VIVRSYLLDNAYSLGTDDEQKGDDTDETDKVDQEERERVALEKTSKTHRLQ
jgi:hypothetical protein